jgi:hypothetical protein
VESVGTIPSRDVTAAIIVATTEGSWRGTDMPFLRKISREFFQFWPT